MTDDCRVRTFVGPLTDPEIEAMLAKELEDFPPSHPRRYPPTEDEAARVLAILNCKPTPRLRLDLHWAICGFVLMITKETQPLQRIRRILDSTVKNPVAALEDMPEDSFEAFIARSLLPTKWVGANGPLDPRLPPINQGLHITEPRDLAIAFVSYVDTARRERDAIPNRGRPRNVGRSAFLGTIRAIARQCGCDLRLPQHDSSRGKTQATPFLLFARAMLELAVQRGRHVLAAAPGMPLTERARATRAFDTCAAMSDLALIRALERERDLVLQETQEMPD